MHEDKFNGENNLRLCNSIIIFYSVQFFRRISGGGKRTWMQINKKNTDRGLTLDLAHMKCFKCMHV